MNPGRLITFNLQMKLLSLLLAGLLWLFVTLEANDDIEIPLAVNFANIPAGLAVKKDSASGLSIRIEGPRILLVRQKLLGVSVNLNLSGEREGRVIFSGFEGSLRLIKGIKPLALSPAKIELTLEPHTKNS